MAKQHNGGRMRGQQLKVDPIREWDKVQAIKQLTKGNPRDHLLFVMGVNSGIRVADLVRLRCGQVRGLSVGEMLAIRETKTKKENYIVVNRPIHKALQDYFKEYPAAQHDGYLFFSRRGGHLNSQAVGNMVQRWCRAVGLNRGRYGCHSLRKTFGTIQRTKYGVAWEIISARYRHSNPAVTRAYLGIQKSEVTKILNNAI